MSSGVGQAILPIAGAAVGFMAGGPAGAAMGLQLGGAASGVMNSGSGGTTVSPTSTTSPQIVSGPGMGGTNLDALDKTWASPQVNAQMTPTTNAASTSVPGSGSKSPGGTGSMGAGDYASLASMGLSAMGAASKAKRDQELADAQIWQARNPLAGTVVRGPDPDIVQTSLGGFPSVNGGFVRY